VGVWDLTTNGTGWQAFGTLSIAKDGDGTLTGKWGSMDLSNVKFDDHQKLTFIRTVRAGDVAFSGTLKDGTLALSNERGGKVTGVRRMPTSPVLGHGDLTCHLGGSDVAARLVVSQKLAGTPEAKWTSDFAQSVVSGVRIKDDERSLSQETVVDSTAFESTFEGTVKGHAPPQSGQSDSLGFKDK
jgi:hypothetical protein